VEALASIGQLMQMPVAYERLREVADGRAFVQAVRDLQAEE
jgi:hypothetical protein